MSSLDLRRRYNVFTIAPPEVFYEYRRYSPMYRKHGFGHMSKYFPVFYRAHENGDYLQILFWVCPDIFGHMSKSVLPDLGICPNPSRPGRAGPALVLVFSIHVVCLGYICIYLDICLDICLAYCWYIGACLYSNIVFRIKVLSYNSICVYHISK